MLTLRELNRALLARQLLLRRVRLPVPRAVERIGGLQAQNPPSPYVALWSRLDGFRIEHLERALARGQVVKATLMRTTLHIVSRADYSAVVAALVPARRERFAALDLDALAEEVLALEPGPQLRERWYEASGAVALKPEERWPLWGAVLMHARLVHAPPSGTFTYRGSPTLARARSDTAPSAPLAELARRYLGAFGPATVDDLSSWSGLRTPLVRQGLEALELRRFRDEKDRLLLDLPRAQLPAADTPAPVRFLPRWDAILLGHAPPERARILPERYRQTVIRKNGDVLPTFLLDGLVAGLWGVAKGRLRLEPFEPLPRRVRSEVEREGERALAFLGGRAP
jgi:Winged helix DNA-binding domain